MKRAGILLFAAVPVVVTAVVYAVAPDPSGSSEGRHGSAAQRARQEARSRAEGERAEDAEAVADAPPGLAAPAEKEPAQRIVASAENSTRD